jgi:hypothetical protein
VLIAPGAVARIAAHDVRHEVDRRALGQAHQQRTHKRH